MFLFVAVPSLKVGVGGMQCMFLSVLHPSRPVGMAWLSTLCLL